MFFVRLLLLLLLYLNEIVGYCSTTVVAFVDQYRRAFIPPFLVPASFVSTVLSASNNKIHSVCNNNNIPSANVVSTSRRRRMSQKLSSTALSASSVDKNNEATTTNSLSLSSNDNNRTKIKILGVCGGIGSGKSTACQLLVSELNCLAHIDADKVAHRVYAPGSEGVNAVVETFGTTVLVVDETTNELKIPYEISRPALGAIVFTNPNAMKQLEQIVWPRTYELIQEQIQQIIQQQQQQQYHEQQDDNNNKIPIIIVEAAMLLDAEWYKKEQFLDGIWIISVTEDVAIDRLITNRGLSNKEATKRIIAQRSRRGIATISEEISNQIVTAVIENNGSLQDLQNQLHTTLHNPNVQWYNSNNNEKQ